MMELEVIRHDSHLHELKLKSYNKLYRCNGCRELGFGLRFRCEQCNFNLHKECAHADQTTSHDFFKNDTFKFFSKPPDRQRRTCCHGCGRDAIGFVYHCEDIGWYLHPCCHSLPCRLKFDYVEFRLRNRVTSTCLWCNKSWSEGTVSVIQGWSYVSECKKYNFHVFCATEMMFQEYEKGVHLGNSLEQSLQGFLEIYLGGIMKRQRRRNIVMSFVITNLVLELTSALLDQVSSSPVNKSQRALFGMLISFAAMLMCIVELIYEFRTEKLIWRWRGTLPFPWYYYLDQRRKPFGTFKDIVGLVCALCQCVDAMVSYYYLRRHAHNLIRISFFPIIFAFGILFSQILKNQDTKNSSRGNETRALTDIVID
ncbi:hypothetical protein LWI29_034081 [Acer saccharum]|uniref:Phorbol-ester/DAG-type domain-containing protein n=1 Tax=Acer saccharum TaxID=4024 RepID=A0AA39VUU6_ACESA|nr:hypothetical protein LWI29_034081 [Acer saccharum]